MTWSQLSFDLASAWRGVRGGRWASAAAVAALTLGIGASVTAAAIAYGGLLRPLPFPNPDRLVTLSKIFASTKFEYGITLTEAEEWQGRLGDAGRLAAYSRDRVTVRHAGLSAEAHAAYVAGPFFDVFGSQPETGRVFADDGLVDVAVLSRRFARRLTGTAASAIGQAVTIGGRELRVVGVMPESFAALGDDVDLWMPARGVDSLRIVGNEDARFYTLVARMPPGVSASQFRERAGAALQGVVSESQRSAWQVVVRPLRDVLLGDSRPVLLIFVAASSLVLLAACANVAMLLVNRAVARAREFTLRLALGATRARLFRALILETAMLAAAGSLLGWWLATVATSAIARQTGLGVSQLAMTTLAGPVTVGALLAAAIVVLLCGAAPLVGIHHAQLATSLRAGASTVSVASRRFRGALVVAQLAVAIVLLVGAGLLGRTLIALGHVDLGLMPPGQVLTMAVPMGQSLSATTAASRAALVDRLLRDVRRLPGVDVAGIGSNLPPDVTQLAFTVRYTSDTRDATMKLDLVSGTDGYLEALGAQLVQGRLFRPADADSDQPVAVISEAVMRHLGMTGNVVDQELNVRLPSASGARVRPRLIGVIRDIRYAGLDVSANGGIYVLWRQIPMGQAFLVMRTSGSPASLIPAVSRVVREADASVPLAEPHTLTDQIDLVLAPRYARFSLVGVYAVAAILLSVVGLTSALIRSVVERQRELAIRAAIGATPEQLMRSVIQHGLALVLGGAIIGVVLSLQATKAAAHVLSGVTASDPLTYGAVLATVLAIALAACYWPARRAARTDPVVLLRGE